MSILNICLLKHLISLLKRIVEKLASILLPAKGQIINKQRFYEEFGEGKDESEKQEPKKSYKPEDFEAIFSGNIDDSFRIGISVAKRTLKVML